VALVKFLLHEALLVLGRQQRQYRRYLVVPHPVPILAAARGEAGARITPAPLAWHRRIGVYRRTAALLGLRQQRLVVLLSRFEGVWAHDRLARVVPVTAAPGGARRAGLADQPGAVGAPLLLDADGAVAPEVALVHPEGFVLVEVLGGEQVHGQRRHTGGHLAVARRPDKGTFDTRRSVEIAEDGCTHHLVLAHVGGQRPTAAHALESRIVHGLRQG